LHELCVIFSAFLLLFSDVQALGMLQWHKHNVDKALADLYNYSSYPDMWTIEDKVLFEQAFSVHAKNFQRFRSLVCQTGCLIHCGFFCISWVIQVCTKC